MRLDGGHNGSLFAVTLAWAFLVPEPPGPLIRYSLALPPGEELVGSVIRPRVALSPDGERGCSTSVRATGGRIGYGFGNAMNLRLPRSSGPRGRKARSFPLTVRGSGL